ncbi:MAG: apolipoprotein N-acyltransferase [Legionellaceae bacterium]|nr:apolipoprotein N-acyltransferase [Legionellaceae bacterium]
MKTYSLVFLAGLLLPLGFAPFHWPVFVIVSLALFHRQLVCKRQNPFLLGFCFGIGYFGLGVSWVWNSIHDYGHLNVLVSTLITLLFILFLSLYTAIFALCFRYCAGKQTSLRSALQFAALWTLFEIARAELMGGFPWLLIGFSQIDTSLAHLLPIIGVYGVGILTALAAALFSQLFLSSGLVRLTAQILIVVIFTTPMLLASRQWVRIDEKTPLSVAVIQSNVSMRDKWDERLYWQILDDYQEKITQTLRKKLIVLPESAIPLPAEYVEQYLRHLDQQAKKAGAAVILGIPEEKQVENTSVYYNSLQVLGRGSGHYYKRHLVPFGEYIPQPFAVLSQWAPLQSANMQSGVAQQTLASAHRRPFASLICYELAYGNLLRQQLPASQWIVSISDDGWFGASLAPYQQQQMAQVRSVQSARYQIMANNDGLSSVIDSKGTIVSSLPAFSSGILEASIFPVQGSTPWIRWGDWPAFGFLSLILLLSLAQHLLSIGRKWTSEPGIPFTGIKSQEK